MPAFLMTNEVDKRSSVVRYDDHDPGRTVRVERVAYGTSDLTRDAVFGAGAVEIRLTKLLLLPRH